MTARPLCPRPACQCHEECWLCTRAPAGVKVWCLAGEPAVYARACARHRSELVLAA